MNAKETFQALLNDFGAATGRHLTVSDEDNTCSFLVDDEIAVNLVLMERSEQILAWTSIGGLPEDEYSEARARRLLELNDGGRETNGFTLSLSREDRRILAHDTRPLVVLDSGDRLAAWVDALVAVVKKVNDEFERNYPFWDDRVETEPEVHELD